MNNRLLEIEWLRVFSVISVVLFHIYGMTYQGEHLMESTRNYNASLYFVPVNCWLINIAMPLFIMISGYLFYFLLDKGKYSSWALFLKKKAIRLVVPYFIFGAIMAISIGNPRGVLTLHHGAFWHLWFLPAIMWCFVVGYIIKSAIKIWWLWGLMTICMLLLIPVSITWPKFFGMKYIQTCMGWFMLGGGLAIYREKIIKIFSKTKFHWIFLVIAIIIAVMNPIEYGERDLSLVISQLLFIVPLWYITVFVLHNLGGDNSKIISSIAWNSFGIYIFHNWIGLYLIGNFSKRVLNLEYIAAAYPILYPFLFFVVVLFISYAITWGIRKTKIGKFLLG